ncbi:MFS transporter [Pseudomonas aeruginosa]|nr:MFS transporter [Pseudomonas aeruginosa]
MPSSPSSLPSALVLLFAVACGLSVANVYYAQPLLDVLGAEFAIGQAGVGLLFGATQAGCALALLLVVPLGDLLERRRLMFVQLLLLVLSLLLVGFAGDTLGLALGLLGLGLLGTAMTQGLLAYAAALAAPGERGRVVGAAQGGVVIGLLLARSLAGLLADLGGWRSVYLVSAASMGGLGLLLWRVLPAAPSNELGLSYRQLLGSMFGLLASQRVLQVRGLLGLLMFAAFGVFWSSLVLLLGAPPYSLSHSAIGAFGLVGALGALGALGAARAGRLADRGPAPARSGGALLLLLLSWLPLALGAHSLAALILGVLLLDLAGQAIHVLNQSLVFAIDPRAHSRLVGCYMLFYAAGSGLGASAGTALYAGAGWDAVSLLGAAISLAALAFWWFTRGVGGEARTACANGA